MCIFEDRRVEPFHGIIANMCYDDHRDKKQQYEPNEGPHTLPYIFIK